jgi:flagellar transcriptional activator FlhC
MARNKSILTEARQIERAVVLINLGARLQVLESETDLSYERLLRLYKEVAGKSPSKGQLPFSTDWFMTWQPNIHASLFLNIHEYLNKATALDEIDVVIKAYQLYLEQIQAQGLEPMLSVTRAWRLVKFVDNGMLTMTACSSCGGHFVTHPHEIAKHYVCGLCHPPARAGKGKAAGTLQMLSEAPALAHLRPVRPKRELLGAAPVHGARRFVVGRSSAVAGVAGCRYPVISTRWRSVHSCRSRLSRCKRTDGGTLQGNQGPERGTAASGPGPIQPARRGLQPDHVCGLVRACVQHQSAAQRRPRSCSEIRALPERRHDRASAP